jgi:hypothetical protein
MSWQPLKTTLANKPLILAGPILRKVTDSSVTVWLALKEQADVTLAIYAGDDVTVARMLFSDHRKSVRIGPNLHLVAVTARRGSEQPLAPGTLYYYNLSFTTNAGTVGLAAAVGASGKAAYAYGSKRLPSFALPPVDLEDVRLVQGSCRKPNAAGPDAMAMLDDIIEASVDSPTGRPHQLLLTGDQIYADEVADVLLLLLTEAASALMVAPEPLPGGPNGSESIADMLPPSTRTDTIQNDAKLTTDDTRSHLMSFGEYIAMYLFVWSEVLWSTSIPDYTDLLIVLQGRPKALTDLPPLMAEITEQRNNVVQFRSTLLKVRRALANVPTAMILDDHEITDDWNMTREFCDNVYGSARGMRIVQNGLLAYALCQHWGNAPEQFENNPLPAGSNPAGVELLHLFDTSVKYADIADNPFLKTALGLHTPDKLFARSPNAVFHDVGDRSQTADGWIDSQSLLYHYTLEAKAYQVIVTDSRTWRSFPLGGKTSPPDLIAQAQLSVQIGQTPKLGDRLLLVVVTTNMPPGPAIRQGARDLPTIVKLDGPKHWYDEFYDSWEILSVNCARMLVEMASKFKQNARKGGIVLLSGDVHASSASRITYSATAQVGDPAGAPTPAELSIAQLIGSAVHNQAEKTIGQHNHGYSYVPAAASTLAQRIILTEGFVGWNPVTTPARTEVSIVDWNDHFTRGGKQPRVFNPNYPTITLRDEELSAPVSNFWSKKLIKITRTPDYRIRLDYLKVTDSGGYTHEPKVIEPSNDPFKSSSEKARAYEDYVSSVRRGSEIVGLNNIGEITFIRHPDSFVSPKLMVRYTVHWYEKGMVQFVRYDVSLDVLDQSFPQLPFPT